MNKYYEARKEAVLDEKRSSAKKVLCYCPKCEKEHYYKWFYTGRLKVPYKFCYACEEELRETEPGRMD